MRKRPQNRPPPHWSRRTLSLSSEEDEEEKIQKRRKWEEEGRARHAEKGHYSEEEEYTSEIDKGLSAKNGTCHDDGGLLPNCNNTHRRSSAKSDKSSDEKLWSDEDRTLSADASSTLSPNDTVIHVTPNGRSVSSDRGLSPSDIPLSSSDRGLSPSDTSISPQEKRLSPTDRHSPSEKRLSPEESCFIKMSPLPQRKERTNGESKSPDDIVWLEDGSKTIVRRPPSRQSQTSEEDDKYWHDVQKRARKEERRRRKEEKRKAKEERRQSRESYNSYNGEERRLSRESRLSETSEERRARQEGEKRLWSDNAVLWPDEGLRQVREDQARGFLDDIDTLRKKRAKRKSQELQKSQELVVLRDLAHAEEIRKARIKLAKRKLASAEQLWNTHERENIRTKKKLVSSEELWRTPEEDKVQVKKKPVSSEELWKLPQIEIVHSKAKLLSCEELSRPNKEMISHASENAEVFKKAHKQETPKAEEYLQDHIETGQTAIEVHQPEMPSTGNLEQFPQTNLDKPEIQSDNLEELPQADIENSYSFDVFDVFKKVQKSDMPSEENVEEFSQADKEPLIGAMANPENAQKLDDERAMRQRILASLAQEPIEEQDTIVEINHAYEEDETDDKPRTKNLDNEQRGEMGPIAEHIEDIDYNEMNRKESVSEEQGMQEVIPKQEESPSEPANQEQQKGKWGKKLWQMAVGLTTQQNEEEKLRNMQSQQTLPGTQQLSESFDENEGMYRRRMRLSRESSRDSTDGGIGAKGINKQAHQKLCQVLTMVKVARRMQSIDQDEPVSCRPLFLIIGHIPLNPLLFTTHVCLAKSVRLNF